MRKALGQQILLRLEISLCAKSVGADPQIVQLTCSPQAPSVEMRVRQMETDDEEEQV
jgi:hypothetical protein